jgi:hypothetical protein
VQNIKIYLTTKIYCHAGHIRSLSWFPDAQAGHVHPSSTRVNQAYPTPYPGSKDLTRTCPTPSSDMSGLSALSGSLSRLQRSNPDMSDLLALSDFLAGFQSQWPDMSDPRLGHVWVSDTPTARFLWGPIKGIHASLAGLATQFNLQTL